MSFATSGQIAASTSTSPATCRATIPLLAASGDTPYFGGNPQLDMTASIPGAQAGLLAASLVQSLPVSDPDAVRRPADQPELPAHFVVPNGTGSVQLPIPNDPNFADAHIYWQGIGLRPDQQRLRHDERHRLAASASSEPTLFAANNGGSIGGIVYFDITVKSGAVIITGFETNCDQVASTPIGLDVYTCPTTYIGNEGTQASWTQVATDDGNAVSAGDGYNPALTLRGIYA
jgi:hypothetical protein